MVRNSEIEKALRDHYGLDLTIERSPLGQANYCFTDRKNTIFIRLHRAGKPEKVVEVEEDALSLLKQEGVKVPIIVPNIRGQLRVLVDGHFMSVYNFVPHLPFSDSPNQLEEAARHHAIVLEKLQKLEIPPSYESHLLGFKSPGSEEWRPRLDPLLTNSDVGIRTRAEALLRHYSKIRSCFPTKVFEGLPKVNVHGDYHALNIGFNPKNDRGMGCVFDLEGTEQQPLAYDLMVSLISFVRCQNRIDQEIVEERAITYLSHFLSASEGTEIGKMAKEQIPIIPLIMRDRLFQFAINDLEMYVSGRKEPFDSCDRNLGLLDFLDKNPDFLQDDILYFKSGEVHE